MWGRGRIKRVKIKLERTSREYERNEMKGKGMYRERLKEINQLGDGKCQ